MEYIWTILVIFIAINIVFGERTCPTGQFFNGLSCKFCNPYCYSCDSDKDCKSCYYYLYVTNNGQCGACPMNCKYCAPPEGKCVTCEEGYFLSEGECKKCEVPYCRSCTDEHSCSMCFSNYQLELGKCNYKGTDIDYYDEYISNVCMDGFYRNSKGECEKCYLEGCTNSCISSSKCFECDPGYYIDNNFHCHKCSDSLCEDCSNGEECQQCKKGSYLDQNSQCHSCNIENCDYCLDSSKCEICEDGYYIDFAHYCTKCDDPNCRICDQYSCSECKDGYFFNGYGCEQKCLIENCVDCSITPRECLECKEKYFLNVDESCQPCPEGCQVCRDSKTCIECAEGYYFDKFLIKCVLIPKHTTSGKEYIKVSFSITIFIISLIFFPFKYDK